MTNTSPDISYLADVYGTISSTGQPLSFWRLIYARGAEVDILNPDVRSSAWREISAAQQRLRTESSERSIDNVIE